MNKNITSTGFFRIFVLLSFIFNIVGLKAQINCEIKLPEGVDLPICYGEEISLHVEANVNHTYQWSKNGIVLSGETDAALNIEVTEKATYSVVVTNTLTQEECSDDIEISVMNEFKIEFEQTQLTCSNNKADNGQTAKVIATASGKGYVSFTYEWYSDYDKNILTNPNNPQEAIGLKAWKEYHVDVTGVTTEGYSCTQTATFIPKAYPNPKLEIISDPKDTAYLENPHVTFGFEGEIDLVEYNSWSWAFYNNPDKNNEITSTSNLQEPTNIYTRTSKSGSPFKVDLNVKSAEYGCDTTFSTDIIVLPVKLKIPNIFTPNGDGINDYFIIDNDPSGGNKNNKERNLEYGNYNPLNDYYLRTKLSIFNRWGRIVYRSEDYKNDWDGGNLPDGTYFYVLECVGEYEEYVRYEGSVTIFGSGR